MPKKFEQMRQAIKKQLIKDNPNMSEEEADKKSYAIAVSQWKKKYGTNPMEDSNDEKFDEEGRVIVSENSKFFMDSSINSIEE